MRDRIPLAVGSDPTAGRERDRILQRGGIGSGTAVGSVPWCLWRRLDRNGIGSWKRRVKSQTVESGYQRVLQLLQATMPANETTQNQMRCFQKYLVWWWDSLHLWSCAEQQSKGELEINLWDRIPLHAGSDPIGCGIGSYSMAGAGSDPAAGRDRIRGGTGIGSWLSLATSGLEWDRILEAAC